MQHVDRVSAATSLLQAYWGTTGPDRDGTAMQAGLRKLKLKKDELLALEDGLPPQQGGTTGERVAECYRFLTRLRSG